MTVDSETRTGRRDGKHRELVVVAHDPGRRMSIASRVDSLRPGEFRTRTLPPDFLSDRARWLDAQAAIVVLGRCSTDRERAELALLGELPLADRILLVVDRNASGADVEDLLSRIDPMLTLDDEPSDHALAAAVDSLARVRDGAPAREQHRKAQGLLGVSRAIRDVAEQIRQVADSRMPVLILGETGTGKEVVARAIHRESGRRARPFVPINCGAVPEALLESELFGTERGAYTGASQSRPGLFEQADGGTLFLDEIGEMPASMQVKLLRVLEDGQTRRLGATESRSVDVRILSATHRDLENEVEAGRFRQDLLFRLNTARIELPPLRRRTVDIPFLAQHFAEEFGAENARDITLSNDFIEALCEHDFPGNVRELRNAVERAIAMAAPGDAVAPEHLPADRVSRVAWPKTGTLRERIAQLEAHVLRETLEQHHGNRTRTAETLGLSRTGLRNKLRRLGIE